MSEYTGPERRHIPPEGSFGMAMVRREGAWNADITRGGTDRRNDSPDYDGFWERASEKDKQIARTA